MITNWIFDLDNTLYDYISSEMRGFNYNHLKYEPNKIQKLKQLNGKRIIFSNGNLLHVMACIRKMKLERVFHKVSCRELHGMKPHFYSYVSLYKIANMNKKDRCIFFDDLIENLVGAKNFGWITVLINPNTKEKDYLQNKNIDFYFPNINEALDFFLSNELN